MKREKEMWLKGDENHRNSFLITNFRSMMPNEGREKEEEKEKKRKQRKKEKRSNWMCTLSFGSGESEGKDMLDRATYLCGSIDRGRGDGHEWKYQRRSLVRR